jgi:hypothetical protein
MHRFYSSRVVKGIVVYNLFCCCWIGGARGCSNTTGGTKFKGNASGTSCCGCAAASGTEFGRGGTRTSDAASDLLTLGFFLLERRPMVFFFLLKCFLALCGTCSSCCVAGCWVGSESSCLDEAESMVRLG